MNKFDRTRQNLTQKSSTLAELFQFLWQRKLWWLMPLVGLLLLVLLLLIFANAAAVVAPFLYTVV